MISRLIASIILPLAIGLAACAPAASPAEEGVTLIIRFEASDAGLDEFVGIMDGVSEAMSAESGFVSAKVYRDVDEANVFILKEVWETKALHQEHFIRINESGDWSHINSLLIEEPQMGYFEPM
ncbi:putative quinol monooxygenase [Erythrobacter ani]|uniref:Antibiotic biosynthesis monooxygenase n=1 Tax=Erythrobacter ani TaxID=2827235 RepID=A0ABS6SNP0_9SPHN|nr:antibiotic biosynthesis monooxygenase [Erythrobacter ani]MBV7266122.1 antibiotic biosynthesis monooxygenase [Erythrobacter ani]